MILELDCGNSSIKWRLVTLAGAQARPVKVSGSFVELVVELGRGIDSIKYCRISSVRSAEFNQELKRQVFDVIKITPDFASSSSSLANVSNGYESPSTLGVDRWLAVVAAYHTYQVNCLVIDCGTAVTADYVDAQGMHRGGVIAPGLRLLRNGLCEVGTLPKSAGISDAQVAQRTDVAIKSGIWAMYQGFVMQQVEHAKKLFSNDFALILTGGDAQLLIPEFAFAHYHPDLVFIGLRLACPYKE